MYAAEAFSSEECKACMIVDGGMDEWMDQGRSGFLACLLCVCMARAEGVDLSRRGFGFRFVWEREGRDEERKGRKGRKFCRWINVHYMEHGMKNIWMYGRERDQ